MVKNTNKQKIDQATEQLTRLLIEHAKWRLSAKKDIGSKTYNNNPSLPIRKRLDELCNTNNHPFDHPTLYNKVFFPEFEDEIKVVLPPSEKWKQYNCFAYALGLEKWVRTPTFTSAVRNKDLKQTIKPMEGDIVVYQEATTIKHAGRYISNSKVASKWAGGPVFEHDIFMCPASYGNSVEYFKAVTKKEAQRIFDSYPVPNA